MKLFWKFFFLLFVVWCLYLPRLQRRRVVALIRARRQREAAQNPASSPDAARSDA